MTDRAADDGLTRAAHEAMPFARVLGVDVVEQGPERVVAMAAWAPERCTAGGRLHGGYLMALADTVASLCAHLNRPPGAQGVTTIEAKTNFVGGSLSGTVTATAEPVHAGRSTIVVQTDVRDDQGGLLSRSLQTQAVLYPRGGRAAG